MKRISDLMTRDVLAVAPEDTLGEAAQKMVERKVGSAVVMDFGRLIGILTERDLMRATAGRTHRGHRHGRNLRPRQWMAATRQSLVPIGRMSSHRSWNRGRSGPSSVSRTSE